MTLQPGSAGLDLNLAVATDLLCGWEVNSPYWDFLLRGVVHCPESLRHLPWGLWSAILPLEHLLS